MQLTDETRKKLMEAIESKLPPSIREDQALWWVEHPEHIPAAIGNLSAVKIPYKRRNKDGEWVEWV